MAILMTNSEIMEKKKAAQPILLDDERESPTRDLDSQLTNTDKMPGRKQKTEDVKWGKEKGGKKK